MCDNKTNGLGRLSAREYHEMMTDPKYTKTMRAGFKSKYQPEYEDLRRLTNYEYAVLMKDSSNIVRRASAAASTSAVASTTESAVASTVDPLGEFVPVRLTDLQELVAKSESGSQSHSDAAPVKTRCFPNPFEVTGPEAVYYLFLKTLNAELESALRHHRPETSPLTWDYLPAGIRNEVTKIVVSCGYQLKTVIDETTHQERVSVIITE